MQKSTPNPAEFLKLFNSDSIGVWEWDLTTDEQQFSDTFIRLLGYDEQEFEVAGFWKNILDSRDLEECRVMLNKVHKQNATFSKTLTFITKQGLKQPILCIGTVVETLNNKPSRIIGIHASVESFSDAEEAIDASTQRLKRIIEAVDAGVWEWDIKTGKDNWSPRFYELLGYNSNEFKASYSYFLNHLVHPKHKKTVEQALAQHLEKKVPYKVELLLQTKVNGYQWFESSGKAEFDGAGKPTVMTGSIVNIHSRKATEIKLQNSEILYKEAERLSQLGVWEYDIETGEVTWTNEIYHIHELPFSFEPNINNVLEFFETESRKIIYGKVDRAINHGESYDLELQLVTARGRTIWVRAIGHPVLKNKQTVRLRGVFQNIDHIKTAQLQVEHSLELLKVKNKKLDNFAHIISHNLKGYATNLNLLVELFDTIKDPETYPLLIEKLRETSINLNETLSDVSTIIKSTEEDQITYQNIKFESKFKGVLKQLHELITQTNAVITYDFKIDSITYNSAYLESILYNLISNGIKYRKIDEPCKIHVSTYRKNGTIHLAVTDNGIGINLERYGDSLFKMYKVVHQRNDSKGLGLYLTKTQIEIMGGTIRVESAPNEGSTFIVDFNR